MSEVSKIEVAYKPRMATRFPGPAPSRTRGLYTTQISQIVGCCYPGVLTSEAGTKHRSCHLTLYSMRDLKHEVFMDSAGKIDDE